MLLAAVVVACNADPAVGAPTATATGAVDEDSGSQEAPVDADGDGYTFDVDCDDQDASANPGAADVCNARDDDCDGLVDEACHAAPLGDLDLSAADTVFVVASPGEGHTSDIDLADADGSGTLDLLLASADSPRWEDPGSCPGAGLYLFTTLPVPGWAASEDPLPRVELAPGGGCMGSAPDLSGDVDGDGVADLLAQDVVSGAFVVPGPVGGSIDAMSSRLSVAREGYFTSARWLGDIDGVPGDDIGLGSNELYIIDDYGEHYQLGEAFVFSSAATGVLSLADATAHIVGWEDESAGGFLGPLGDLDGDGFDDFTLDGDVVFLGPVTGELLAADADLRLHRPSLPKFLGRMGIPGGDVDGDGRDDAWIGGHFQEDRGDSYGGVVLVAQADLGAASYLDIRVRVEVNRSRDPSSAVCDSPAAGDFDGDGAPDVALGHGPDIDEIADVVVFIEYGPFVGVREVGGGGRLHPPAGTGYVGGFGYGLSAGDVNGDGFDDLAIGEAQQSEDTPLYAWLVLGGPPAL
jgi:hypothetical protein